ncbi:MAG: AAA family ATPase [Peptococcaceae bacterium]|jgi:energy-coupling factor transporter ATP-binding protein EcfA2|nr:AAA family ATPase [Peptococcaceae bacterium]
MSPFNANAITRVEIRDFLVFKGEFAADFCPGVNVLIGGNGSGKTTLMKVMYAACQFSGGGDKTWDKKSGVYDRGDDFSRVFSNHFIAKPGEYSAKVVVAGKELRTASDGHRFRGLGGGYPKVNTLFIPVTNVLAHAEGMLELNSKYKIPFDQTEIDMLVNIGLPDAREVSPLSKLLLKKIGGIIYGEVVNLDGVFYVKKSDDELIEAALDADGYNKFGLLWKLLRNGLLEPGSVLFWDEPEASVNPELIPTLVDILLELRRGGVQIFVATHSYDVARWFELSVKPGDALRYLNLRKTASVIAADAADDYVSLTNCLIEDAGDMLLRRVTEAVNAASCYKSAAGTASA